MVVYLYKAKKGPEEIIEGKIEASSEKEAIEKLNQLGYVPVKLEIYSQEIKKKIISKDNFIPRVKSYQITLFSRQLASLLKSGMPILSALSVLQQQTENPSLQFVLIDIHNSVREGMSLSEAMAKYPRIFSSLYIALIKTGENSGTLPEVLLKIAEYRRQQEEFLNKVRMALLYPLFMIVVGTGTVIFMLTFVLPKVNQIFVNLKQQLPLPTRIVLKISYLLRTNWFWFLMGLMLIFWLILHYIKTEKGRWGFDRFKLKIPLVGKFILKTQLCRFSTTLGFLLRSGISIIRAIELSIPVLNNEILKDCFKNALRELQQGGSFGKSLKNYPFIPIFMSNLIIIGEESGRLAEAMEEIAFAYFQDTEEKVKIFTALLEPLLILFIGAIVGFIVIAMLLPIFEMNLAIR